jgi:hypothetical protein
MKVRVLGCSGAIARDCRTISFLIDDNILVDAGTGVGDLTLDENAQDRLCVFDAFLLGPYCCAAADVGCCLFLLAQLTSGDSRAARPN